MYVSFSSSYGLPLLQSPPPRLTIIPLLQSQRSHPHLCRNPTSPPHLPDVLEVRRLDPARDYELHARGSVRRHEFDSMAQYHSEADEFGGRGGRVVDCGLLLCVGGDQRTGLCGE